ncbi:uncharacterized protein B0H18DRAFT_1036150 [Fomitopsis serialis]|uniref:uncharacterized protein n=1 Tax=Fomitopsis serialis TaxID=139415 RepID=UPI0020072BA7|nr:uncharacterized protein B0H18DRAFT_1036150 [Neoantrodia serialis]KAH9917005.1 hypothetical protein B0H18DRAFT_1036150 [Neoantrodia serialis]
MATVDVPSRVSSDSRQQASAAREVIDVDSFDDDEVTILDGPLPYRHSTGSVPHITGARGPSGSSSASAIFVESDDEVEVTRVENAHARRRFLSPPPRPIQPLYIPPVPPIPRNLAGHSSFPARLGRREGAPPPAIRPIARPFPFEARLGQPLARGHTPPVDVPHPAPAARSHHQPVMGLGGALIAFNRQNFIAEVNRQREEAVQLEEMRLPERGWRRLLPDIVNNWWDGPEPAPQRRLPGQAEIYPGGLMLNEPINDLEDLEFIRDILDDDRFGVPRGPLAVVERPREQHYKPSYTHPDKPVPGFTFDFAPSEVPSTSATSSSIIVLNDDGEITEGPSRTSANSSVVEASASLVCARCNDPLSLTAESAAPEEEIARRRIWGLRCGHMLDGKCVQELMSPPAPPPPPPPPPPPADVQEAMDDPKGKGKARDVSHADIAMDIGEPDLPVSSTGKRRGAGKEATTSRKGKRKAAEMLHPESDPPLADAPGPVSADVPPEDNSIRSRLRPRHPRQASHAVAHEPIAESVPSPLSPARLVGASPRRRGRGSSSTTRVRGKGKGKAKPTIEAVHQWTCPVAGCGHVHASIRVDGEWKMNPQEGAISLFI